MAARVCRLHYYLWYEVRVNWMTYPKDLQEEIRKAGWEPPRPARNESGEDSLLNDSGEDFLYMHRQAIRYANKILSRVEDPEYKRVEGWIKNTGP